MLLTACGQSSPKADDIAIQMQALCDKNNGEGFMKIVDLSVQDFYKKEDVYYAIIDLKIEYLISKSEYFEKLKEKDEGIMLGMMTQMIGASLGNFEKGEIRESKGEHIRILKSQNGWVVDPE